MVEDRTFLMFLSLKCHSLHKMLCGNIVWIYSRQDTLFLLCHISVLLTLHFKAPGLTCYGCLVIQSFLFFFPKMDQSKRFSLLHLLVMIQVFALCNSLVTSLVLWDLHFYFHTKCIKHHFTQLYQLGQKKTPDIFQINI